MIRLFKIIAVSGLFFLINLNHIYAQVVQSTSATGHIFAEIIPVFSAREIAQLNFGRFSPGPQGGTIIVTPQSMVSVTGSVFKGIGSHNAASFYVTGDADAAYSITLPQNPVILTNVSNAKTMVIHDWASEPQQGTATGMLQGGFQIVKVGATLKVGTMEDNPIGIYAGSYMVTFDFN